MSDFVLFGETLIQGEVHFSCTCEINSDIRFPLFEDAIRFNVNFEYMNAEEKFIIYNLF